MSTLFGLSMDRLMAVLLACCLAIGLTLAVLALRHRVLLALALRNVPRRRLQTGLIVGGLMLSTAIISSSFTTGDTMTYSTRAVIADSLGRIDEIITARSGFSGARLGPDGLPGVTNGYFAAAEFARLRPQLLAVPGVAAVAPAISETVSLVDATSHQSKSKLTLIALPLDYDPNFGPLLTLDGQRLTLTDAGSDGIYVNREGADALGARDGDQIQLFFGEQPAAVRLRAVVRNGGPGGSQPAVIAPLPLVQKILGHAGQINQIYLANRGDALSSDQWSATVTPKVQALLVDEGSATALLRLLQDPATAQRLTSAPALRPATRARLAALVQAAQRSPHGAPPSEHFRALLGDRQALLALGEAGFRLTDPAARDQLLRALYGVSAVSVTDVKHQALLAANTVGSVITSIFVGLGLFSIASGTLLIFLIFVLLAAERRTELGVARALGMQRGHLIEHFLFEGGAYDLAAGVCGVVLGLAVGVGTVASISALLASVDLRLTFHVEPRSVVVAFCLGLLLTFLTVAASAWRVSRLNIVAAIRDLPDAAQRSIGRGLARRLPLDIRPPLLLAASVLVARAAQGNTAWLPVETLAVSGAIVGAALTLRVVLALLRVPAALRDRVCYTLAGLALLAYWASPFNLLNGVRAADLQAGVELYFLAGIAMVAGAVWAVVYNADALVIPLAGLLGRLFPIGAALRMAAAYALRQRFRTGMALAMFALVVFTMVVAAVLSSASTTAYDDFGAEEGGFDIRGDLRAGQSIPNLPRALQTAPGVKPADFAAAGSFTTFAGQAIETSAGNGVWRSVSLNAADVGFLNGSQFDLLARASGYGSDAAVWHALATTPGLAVVDASALPVPGAASNQFVLNGVQAGQRTFAPATVWVRAASGGKPVKLRVIGVLDARAAFGAGLTSSTATFSGAMPLPPPSTFYFRVRPGLDVHEIARGLGLSFVNQGMQTQVLGDELKRTEGIRLLLNELVESYLGLGLVVGVAALGVISTRAVVERRQQIGMLRALGFQRSTVQASFLLEAAFIAIGGALIGIALGLRLAQNLTGYIASGHPEIVFHVPWPQLAAVALIAGGSGLIAAWLPARRAAAVLPAEALRYE